MEAGDRNMVRASWDRLHALPGGKRAFSAFVARVAPYTGTIGARVEEVRRGHAQVSMRDRPGLRNPFRSLHAVALTNLAELAGNLAVAYTLPDDARFIVAGMSIDFAKKARGTITATGTCPAALGGERQELCVPVVLRDASGDEVARAELRTLIGPKKKA
ncbi:MAG: hotdog fold domain-containing protein [Myxococcota bacterium]